MESLKFEISESDMLIEKSENLSEVLRKKGVPHNVLNAKFHELEAQKNLLFAVSPGKYEELLSSDETRFAGHGNLDATCPPTEHFTAPLPGRAEGDIALYLPPLVGLILENVK